MKLGNNSVMEMFRDMIDEIKIDGVKIVHFGPPQWNPYADIFLDDRLILRIIMTDSGPDERYDFTFYFGGVSDKKIGSSKYSETIILCEPNNKERSIEGILFGDPRFIDKIKDRIRGFR